MTESAKDKVIKHSLMNFNNHNYNWASRALMRWIKEDPASAESIIDDMLTYEKDCGGRLAGPAFDKRLDHGGIYVHVLINCIEDYPVLIGYLSTELREHVGSLVEKYRPLRDYEKKLLSGIVSGGAWRVLNERDPAMKNGEFISGLTSALQLWFKLSAQIAVGGVMKWDAVTKRP